MMRKIPMKKKKKTIGMKVTEMPANALESGNAFNAVTYDL
jgi:hypothetical protein